MLAKKGNSWNPSQNEQPLDEGLIAAIAKIMAERGMRSPGYSPGFQEGLGQGAMEDGYARDAGLANQMYAPAQMAPQPQPLPGVGSGADLGLANAGYEAVPEGVSYEDGSVQQEPAVKQDMKPKKKGEFSDFFKVLRAAKSGDKDIKKGFSELASQLEAEGTVSAT